MMNDEFNEEEYLLEMQSQQTLITPRTSLPIRAPEQDDEFTIAQNERIIKAADELLLDRMENMD